MQNESATSNIMKMRQRLKSFVPQMDQIKQVAQRFDTELNEALNAPNTAASNTEGVYALDAYVKQLPTVRRSGSHWCLSLEEFGIRAARLRFDSAANVAIDESFIPFSAESELNLCDAKMTASIFAETACTAVQTLLKQTNQTHPDHPHRFILTSCHFIVKAHDMNTLFLYQESVLGKLSPIDSLAHSNVLYLFRVKFAKHNLPVEVVDIISHTGARIIACNAALPADYPRCSVAFHVDELVQASVVIPELFHTKIAGVLVDVDVASFNGNVVDPFTSVTTYGLPYTVADFQIRTSEKHAFCQHFRDLEYMVGTRKMAELARLAVVRVFEKDAPALAWVPDLFTLDDLLAILEDKPDLAVTSQIIQRVWDCTDTEKVQIIRKVVVALISRSAALVACCIAKLALKTGKLQPALGGVTVVMSGILGSNVLYRGLIKHYIDKLCDRDMSGLVYFQVSAANAALIGAAQYGLSLL